MITTFIFTIKKWIKQISDLVGHQLNDSRAFLYELQKNIYDNWN